MFKKILSALAIMVIFSSSAPALAQVRDTDITIDVSPEFPIPNQEAKAIVRAYATDLGKAYITWSINNERRSAGIGKNEFSFNTGDLEKINITVSIDTPTGQSLVKTINVTPTLVDLLWEAADSYAPPFYKGKTLVGSEGVFKIVAIPSISDDGGKKLHSGNLSYMWTKDGNPERSASGWGKDSFLFKNSYLDRGNNIKVVVSDILGTMNTGSEISLGTSQPKIVFYEKDSVLGVKTEKALKSGFTVERDGMTLTAIPYFITPKNLRSRELSWQWSLGGQAIDTPPSINEVSIRPEGARGGTSTIKLNINNNKALFSDLEHEINVSF